MIPIRDQRERIRMNLNKRMSTKQSIISKDTKKAVDKID